MGLADSRTLRLLSELLGEAAVNATAVARPGVPVIIHSQNHWSSCRNLFAFNSVYICSDANALFSAALCNEVSPVMLWMSYFIPKGAAY